MGKGGWAILGVIMMVLGFLLQGTGAGWIFIAIGGIVLFLSMVTYRLELDKRESTTAHQNNLKNDRTYPKNYQPSTTIPQSPINESDLQDGFLKFDWKQMEELTGELFRKKGYSVEVTQGSGDYGIDVWAKKDGMTIGIQVKKWRNDVGFEDVAKTLGSNMSKANKYILISTTSFFTPQAWKHQKQHSTIIELWDTNKFREELRNNFVNTSNNNSAPISTNTDSFDYDKGFNIDEVFDVHKESREWKTRD